MRGYDESTYGERWADIYDDWYDDPDEVRDTVTFLDALASGGRSDAPGGSIRSAGPILGFGIGTGRLALPLAALGHDVRGVDASDAMVQRLRAKPGGDAIPVAVGDMVEVPVPARAGEPAPRPYAGVFVAYNTFFGLVSEHAQRRCLAHVAEVLEPGGWFVVAAFVPDADAGSRSGTVGVRSLDVDRVVLTADVHDTDAQLISGQFVDISAAGITLRPFHIRYLFPTQLDAMARDAGLELVERRSSWTGAPFVPESDMHVSVYRRSG